MSKPKQAPTAVDWRITLRRDMVPAGRCTIKVFTSPTAFDGYVGALRGLGVPVQFTSPFVAHCQDTQ